MDRNGLSPQTSFAEHEELRKAINQTFYRTIEEISKLKLEMEQATAQSRLLRSKGAPQITLQRLKDLKTTMKHLKELAETCLRRIDLTEEQFVKPDAPPSEKKLPSVKSRKSAKKVLKSLITRLLCRL
jgi:hypothetical protein